MKPSDVLKGALVLLRDGEGWTRGGLAKRQGHLVDDYSEADSFCSVGACEAASGSTKITEITGDAVGAIQYLNKSRRDSIVYWQDCQTSFEPIREMFDNAIALAESEGQ